MVYRRYGKPVSEEQTNRITEKQIRRSLRNRQRELQRDIAAKAAVTK